MGARPFAAEVLYLYALVELDEGPRVLTNLVQVDPEEVRIGMAVKVRFTHASDEIALPHFEPA
jgi:uncharacterized OB-fold protein